MKGGSDGTYKTVWYLLDAHAGYCKVLVLPRIGRAFGEGYPLKVEVSWMITYKDALELTVKKM